MKLFGQIVRTLVNVVELPVEVVKDVFTLGGVVMDEPQSYTRKQLEKIAEDASE